MIILGTNSIKDTGYDVANSLRFNSGSSDNLSKSLSTPTNDKKFTFSCWFKKSKNATEMNLFGYQPSGNAEAYIGFSDSDQIRYADRDSSDTTPEIFLVSNAKLRDVSAWYHVVVSVDTTQGTDSNRTKLYLNGEQITSLANSTYPSQNYTPEMNSSDGTKVIGADNNGNYFNGYLAEVVMIDGTALDPTSFGEFDEDSGIWKPKDVSGLTFGTNGFYLDFEDSSALGNDVAGSNNFTVNNLTAIDQSTDTCTNNFATLNSLNVPTSNAPTFSEGNLKGTSNSSGKFIGSSTIGVNSGKWYMEVKVTEQDGSNSYVGVADEGGTTENARNNSNGYGNGILYKTNGQYRRSTNGSTADVSYGNSYAQGDIIGIALNCDDNEIVFYKNGTAQNSGTAISIPTPDGFLFLNIALGSARTESFEANFGSPPYAISSGNTDGNGYGNFEYAVPSGYYALNTKNLAEYG